MLSSSFLYLAMEGVVGFGVELRLRRSYEVKKKKSSTLKFHMKQGNDEPSEPLLP